MARFKMFLTFNGNRDGAIAMEDINGDDKPEVLISGVDNSNARITKLYKNTTLTNTINLKAEEEFFIFPNPVENQLTIKNGEGIITIYNLLGQLLLQKNNTQSSVSINVSDLPNGQYFIHITKSNGQILVKQFYK